MTTTIPILPALDMKATVAFYQRLGFALLSDYGDYAILALDGAELHFWGCTERHIAENSGCYIRVADVDALHTRWVPLREEFKEMKLMPPQDRDWGQRECYVIDLSGNLLRFGQPVK